MADEKEEPLEVVFEEGCFDQLVIDGATQEEIDELKAMIMAEVARGKEHLESISRPLNEEEIEIIDNLKKETRQ